MTIKPIRTDDDLQHAFKRLGKVFQAEAGTSRADERDVLVALIEAYENKHYDFGPSDTVDAIKKSAAICRGVMAATGEPAQG